MLGQQLVCKLQVGEQAQLVFQRAAETICSHIQKFKIIQMDIPKVQKKYLAIEKE